MHAAQRESMGQAYSEAVAVTDDAPLSRSADAVLISTDSKEAGLWLWQGEAPPPPSLSRPKSRHQQILPRIMSAAGWAGWIALPIAGLALMLIAVLMMPHPDRPSPADMPTVAPSSATLPTVAGPIVSTPSAELTTAPSPIVPRQVVAVPPAEPATAHLDQEKVPSAPAAENMTRGPEPPIAKSGARHKLSRTARKIHASHVRRAPLFPKPGVLTPPPMTWHGGGY
jgi:hypothetical protein